MIAATLAALSRPLPPPSTAPVTITGPNRARVACHLCSAISVMGDAELVALRSHAREACYAIDRRWPPTRAAQLARRAQAEAVHAAICERPREEQIYVLVAVVRELLTDAPDLCERVDREVRDAARRFECRLTAEHHAAALEIVAREVGL